MFVWGWLAAFQQNIFLIMTFRLMSAVKQWPVDLSDCLVRYKTDEQ